MLMHIIAIQNPSVRLSVRLSVRRWYWVKTAEDIVTIFSPHDSPFILVLCVLPCSPKLRRGHPLRGAKQRWDKKMSQFSTNTSHRYIAISQKWLKIDVYKQRGFLQALNPLSIHVKFIAIVQGRNQGRPKCAQKSAKMVNFWTYGLNYRETVEDRCLHAAKRFIRIESSPLRGRGQSHVSYFFKFWDPLRNFWTGEARHFVFSLLDRAQRVISDGWRITPSGGVARVTWPTL